MSVQYVSVLMLITALGTRTLGCRSIPAPTMTTAAVARDALLFPQLRHLAAISSTLVSLFLYLFSC